MPRKRRDWSRAEYDRLEQMINDGCRHADIAQSLGRTLGSIQSAAARLALTDRATAWNRRRDWPEIDTILAECIESRCMTVPQAAKFLAATGRPVNCHMLYKRLKDMPRGTQQQARENSRLRRAATARRMRMRIKHAA